MPPGADDHKKLACRPAVPAGISFDGDTNPLAVERACFKPRCQRLGAANHAFSVSHRAGRNVLSGSVAARTGHVELHASSGLLDRTLALALRTHARRLNVAVAVAIATNILPRDVQFHHAAANRRPEGNVDLIFEIRTRLRPFLRPRAASAKHTGKNVAKSPSAAGAAVSPRALDHAGEIESSEVEGQNLAGSARLRHWKSSESPGSGRASTRVSLPGSGVNVVGVIAQLVVKFALLWIAQNVIGLGHGLESLFGGLVSRVDVRMIFTRKFAKRLADLVSRGRLLYAEKFVIVFLGCGRH